MRRRLDTVQAPRRAARHRARRARSVFRRGAWPHPRARRPHRRPSSGPRGRGPAPAARSGQRRTAARSPAPFPPTPGPPRSSIASNHRPLHPTPPAGSSSRGRIRGGDVAPQPQGESGQTVAGLRRDRGRDLAGMTSAVGARDLQAGLRQRSAGNQRRDACAAGTGPDHRGAAGSPCRCARSTRPRTTRMGSDDRPFEAGTERARARTRCRAAIWDSPSSRRCVHRAPATPAR